MNNVWNWSLKVNILMFNIMDMYSGYIFRLMLLLSENFFVNWNKIRWIKDLINVGLI